MPEVTFGGVDQRHTESVGGFDDDRVPQRAAGLNHRPHSGLGGGLDAIRERKERIRGQRRSARALSGLATGDGHRIDTARLATPGADDGASGSEQDCIRAHKRDHAPRKRQVFPLLGGGLAVAYHLELIPCRHVTIPLLHQEGAGNGADLQRHLARGPATPLQESTLLAPPGTVPDGVCRPRKELRGVNHLEEVLLRGDSRGEPLIEGLGERDYAAERRKRIAGHRCRERLAQVGTLRGSARQAVLHHHRRGTAQRGGALDGRRRVE